MNVEFSGKWNTAVCALVIFMMASVVSAAQSKISTASIRVAGDKVEPKVIEWRHIIHEHPELGNREFHTAEMIAKHLQSLGIETKTGLAKTGVTGILKGDRPGPVIALRADMDALPVEEPNGLPYASKVKTMDNGQETPVMHACGHDAHVAILMGVAEILAGMKKELKGTLKFIFQPAEEGTPKGEEGGAELMVKEGVLENPTVDVIFGLHMNPLMEVGKIGYRPAGIMASVSQFKITVTGKPAHGSKPWMGVDPIVVAAEIVNSLQTIVSRNMNLTENAVVLTVGSIKGGNRPNIISKQVEMEGDIRSFSDADSTLVHARLRQIVQKTAEAAGATATVDLPPYNLYFPVTFNNVALTSAMLPTLERSAGKENVLLLPAQTGAEDFSFFARKVPGLYFVIGALPNGKDPSTAASLHTPEVIIDDHAFKTGLNAFCNLVIDYMDMKK